MAKQKAKFYVVWQGRESGIYDSWAACEAQVKGVAAKYKGFATRAEAEAALAANPEDYITRKSTAEGNLLSTAKRSISYPPCPRGRCCMFRQPWIDGISWRDC